jgi:hypothetical protein
VNPQEVAQAFLSNINAVVAGHHAVTTADGTTYHFYRGKIKGKQGEKSAPRVLVVAQPSGKICDPQPLGSYERKKLRFFLKKHG